MTERTQRLDPQHSFPVEDYKVAADGLHKHFPLKAGIVSQIVKGESDSAVRAVDDVTFGIEEGESFGLAGESGCGKTTLGKTIIRLLEPTAGSIYFDGEDVTNIDGSALKSYRREVQIIHQDPYQSINPRFRVYRWIREPLDIHGLGTEEERDARVYEVLEMAGLRPAEEYATEYPTELSGGERQRVGIARALALGPSFLLADEPASMLDVSIRASVLEVFQRLQRELNMTSLYISHDLSLLKHICDRIGIMYLGELVEVGPANEIINNPQHPYTQALVSSVPRIDPTIDRERIELVGKVPDPVDVPSGCRFNPRCPNLVPPEDIELDQPVWRNVANLRQDLLSDELAILIEEETDLETVKSEYGIPGTTGDPTVDGIIDDAVIAFLNSTESDSGGFFQRFSIFDRNGSKDDNRELTEAVATLKTELSSPCESPPIPMYQPTDVQRSKCLLHDADGPYSIEHRT